MLEGYSPIIQALLGTLFTWGLTAAGAALVFVFSSHQVKKSLLYQHVKPPRSVSPCVLQYICLRQPDIQSVKTGYLEVKK